MIRLEQLNKSYNLAQSSLHVLRDLDLTVERGELVAIMGSSGSGKSTLLNILGILDDYDTGSYRLDDVLIRDLSEHQAAVYRNRYIGFVFQSFNLLPFKTAAENVALPLFYQKVSRRKRNTIALEYLDRVGLAGHQFIENSIITGGRFLNDADLRERRKVAVIGPRIVDRLFGRRDPVGEWIEVSGTPYRVVGTYTDEGREGELAKIYIPITTAQTAYGGGSNIQQIMFTVGDATAEEARQIEEQTRRMLAARHQFALDDERAIRIRNSLESAERVFRLFASIRVFIWIVGLGTILAGIIGVSNIMLISVRERTREIGLRKALGATPGTIVRQIVPNMAALTQAESAVYKARIAVSHAKAELRRAERLSGDGLLSQRVLSERKLDHNLRRAELRAATSQLQVVKEGASRSRGETANTKIRSTVAGMVLEVPVEEGGSVIESNNFNEGTTIATVADMGDMIFLGRIDEADVDKIRTGMAAKIRIGAIDEHQFDGKLEYIAPKGKQIEGAIQFETKAALESEKGVVIRAGYSANAEIVLAEKNQVLAVSESLLQFDGEQPYVEIETAPGVYERRDLTVGISDGINIEVKDGVTAESKIR